MREELCPHLIDTEVGHILGRVDELGFAPKPEILGSWRRL